MNRRQVLSTLFVAGTSSSLGLVTAAPAVASGPPRGARRLRFEQAATYTNEGVVNYQALLGVFQIEGDVLPTAYWGVKLHNTGRRPHTVQYDCFRALWIAGSYESQRDDVRTWTLAPDQRRTIWFGGSRPWLANAVKLLGVGNLRYDRRPWGSSTIVGLS